MELNLLHKETLDENNLNQSDLPKDIQSRIQSLFLLIDSYRRNPEEELKESIEHESALISHKILDFLEEDLDYEDFVQPNQSENNHPVNNQQQNQSETPKQEDKNSSWTFFNF